VPTLKYADQTLLMEDPGGVMQAFVTTYIDSYNSRIDTQSIVRTSLRNAGRYRWPNHTALPRPNYVPPPLPQVNTLYWPTGAARWAAGYFYCSEAIKDKIVTSVSESTNISAKTLEIFDGNVTLKTDMFLLPPRPVTAVPDASASGGPERLFLLPLVDERWYWQQKEVPVTFYDGATSTWATLVTAIGTALGVTITIDTVSTDYALPDNIELDRGLENAAILLDAIAHSVGARVVRWPDGTVKVISPADSTTQLAKNIKDNFESAEVWKRKSAQWSQIAGGDLSTEAQGTLHPTSVSTSFTKRNVDTAGDTVLLDAQHESEYTLAEFDATIKSVASTKHVIFTSALANFEGGSPANSTEVDALADAIGKAHYDWLAKKFDYVYNGVKVWDSSGYDDYVEWHVGAQRSDGSYAMKTRAQSQPYNFGVQEQLSMFSGVQRYALIVSTKPYGMVPAHCIPAT
jgi:hypothetical protein